MKPLTREQIQSDRDYIVITLRNHRLMYNDDLEVYGKGMSYWSTKGHYDLQAFVEHFTDHRAQLNVVPGAFLLADTKANTNIVIDGKVNPRQPLEWSRMIVACDADTFSSMRRELNKLSQDDFKQVREEYLDQWNRKVMEEAFRKGDLNEHTVNGRLARAVARPIKRAYRKNRKELQQQAFARYLKQQEAL